MQEEQVNANQVRAALRRKLLIILSPISLPVYLLVQAAVFVTAACYYLTITCGLERLLRRPVSLPGWKGYVAAPVVVAISPVVLAVQLVVWLLVGLGKGVVGAGRWQSGLSGWRSAVAGGVWTALLVWLVVACLSPPTGWAMLGAEVPGLKDHLGAVRDELRLGELSEDLQQRRALLIERLQRRADLGQELGGVIASLSDDEWPYMDLSPEYQRRIVGMPAYYDPPMYLEEGVGRSGGLWGTLLLGVLLLVRWPGLRGAASGAGWRCAGFAARVGMATAAAGTSFVGRIEHVDRWALLVGAALVLLGMTVLVYRLGAKLLSSARLGRYYSAFVAARLLQRRRIAFFSVGAVTLCVAMVLIVVSVMGGFLDTIRQRSRGLLGDLVLESGRPLQGFPFYQEFIDHISSWPEVEAATPVIYSYGIMRLQPDKRTKAVRIVGMRLEGAYRVNAFRQSLFYEDWYPGMTKMDKGLQPLSGVRDGRRVLPAEFEAVLARVGPLPEQFTRRAARAFPGPGVFARVEDGTKGRVAWNVALGLLDGLQFQAELMAQTKAMSEKSTSVGWEQLAAGQRELAEAVRRIAADLPEDEELAAAGAKMVRGEELLAKAADRIRPGQLAGAVDLQDQAWEVLNGAFTDLRDFLGGARYEGPALPGVIIGVDLLAERTSSGKYHRPRLYPRGCKVDLTVLPLSPESAQPVPTGPERKTFRYVDDSHTGVHEIDSFCVYVDFELIQRLLGMGAEQRTEEAGGGMAAARCSQIQIKVAAGDDPLALQERLRRAWGEHAAAMPADGDERSLMADVWVMTWEEMQSVIIAAVEKEKALVTTLFGVISLVAVFLVLCIFYMIVQEKIRDIGIIKSVGGSAAGVAGIFLGYGAAIGAVGAMLGVAMGTLFVRYINEIQDWLASIYPGLRIWSAEVYVFDRIPSAVKGSDVAVIMVVAILAAILGAVIPAWRAARTWPAEALRYE